MALGVPAAVLLLAASELRTSVSLSGRSPDPTVPMPIWLSAAVAPSTAATKAATTTADTRATRFLIAPLCLTPATAVLMNS